jgi:RNA-directed DNA polymerase
MTPQNTSAKVPATAKQTEDTSRLCLGVKAGVWTEPMLAALEKGLKGNKWFALMDKIYADKTLRSSWEKVKSNAGACGVDGITVERYAKDSQNRLLVVKQQLMQSSYRPSAIKRVWIPKPGSADKRPLGIPTITDRVVQTATRTVIEPIFESKFAPQSYGFRPGRGCKDALRRVDELLMKEERLHIVDVDIKRYFDTIPHDRLMALVKEHIADGRVLALIESFLKQGVMQETESQTEQEEDTATASEEGTPQGGVISPLLANIYLNPLDWLMREHGHEMVRYADDMVVLCRTREEAETALSRICEWMTQAGLDLHPEKTRLVDMTQRGSHFDFLGYRFYRAKKSGQIRRLVRPKSEQKLKDALRPLTKRANGHSMKTICDRINPKLKGWYGYFRHAYHTVMTEMDGWVRGRLRSILRKRSKRKGRARGKDHHRWPNRYFTELGLFSLKEARAEDIANLRQGANC